VIDGILCGRPDLMPGDTLIKLSAFRRRDLEYHLTGLHCSLGPHNSTSLSRNAISIGSSVFAGIAVYADAQRLQQSFSDGVAVRYVLLGPDSQNILRLIIRLS